MGQLNAERAFHAAFAALGYTYVSYPNGPKLNLPSAPIPASTIWYSLFTLYSKAAAVGLGSSIIRYPGLFQVTIKAPSADANGNPYGTYAIAAAAEAVAAAFKLGTSIAYPTGTPVAYVHCEEPTITHIGNVEPEWYTVVVRVPFRMDN
jgi:hypothetical protein